MRTNPWPDWRKWKVINSAKNFDLSEERLTTKIKSEDEKNASGINISDPNGQINKFINSPQGLERREANKRS